MPQMMQLKTHLFATAIRGSIQISLSAAPLAKQPERDLKLWYREPARNWGSALALGNGRLGAMVFGGTELERIGLNEDTLWSGGPYEPSTEVSSATREEIRKLMFEGKYGDAQNLSNKLQGTPNSQASYQTVGEIQLAFPGHGRVTGYRRELDLNDAVVTVTYQVDGVNFRRETFVSPVDQVVVVRITADQPGKLDLTASYTSPLENQVTADSEYLRVTGKNGDLLNRANDAAVAKGALVFESRTHVLGSGGKVSAADGTISVRGADAVTLLIASATNFKRYDDISGDPGALVSATLAAASRKSYDAIRAAHVAEHQRLFGRVQIDFGNTPAAAQPTDERVRNDAKRDDPALAALHFQFGRYLLSIRATDFQMRLVS